MSENPAWAARARLGSRTREEHVHTAAQRAQQTTTHEDYLYCSRRAKWTDVGPSAGGKGADYDSGLSTIDQYAQRVFADQIALFRPAVAAADPKGVFRNAWLTEIFGLA